VVCDSCLQDYSKSIKLNGFKNQPVTHILHYCRWKISCTIGRCSLSYELLGYWDDADRLFGHSLDDKMYLVVAPSTADNRGNAANNEEKVTTLPM
jgi:hypothetical protein